LGHKAEMPGSGCWDMLTGTGDSCWVCDKWIYTLIFWNENIGYRTNMELDLFEKDKIQMQMDEVNKDNV